MDQTLILAEEEQSMGARICSGIFNGIKIALLVILTYGLMVAMFAVWFLSFYSVSKLKKSRDPSPLAIWLEEVSYSHFSVHM